MISLRKPKSAPAAPAADELEVAMQKAAELTDRRRELHARRASIEGMLHEISANGPAARVQELLGDGGQPRRGYSTLSSELQDVMIELGAIRAAQRQHAERVAELRHRHSAAIAAEFKPRHRQAVAGIAKALDQLEAAMAAEASVRGAMVDAGASPDALPAFQVSLELLRARCRSYTEDDR